MNSVGDLYSADAGDHRIRRVANETLFTLSNLGAVNFTTAGRSVPVSVVAGSARIEVSSGRANPFGLAILGFRQENVLAAPVVAAVFSFWKDTVTVTEAAATASHTGPAFQIYTEASGDFDRGAIGSMQMGIAISNVTSVVARVRLERIRMDGSPLGLAASIGLPPYSQVAKFLNQIEGLKPFQGVLRISSNPPVAVAGLRGRFNERGFIGSQSGQALNLTLR